MTAKRFPITQAYNVMLMCDKCGKELKYTNFFVDSNEIVKFQYRCECGFIATSTKKYPYQTIDFDISRGVEVEE